MKRRTLAWLLPLMAAGGGCASTPEVRNLSDKTGLYVTSLREGTAEFVAAQSRLNAQNEAHLQRLSAKAAAAGAQVQRQRLAWTSGQERAALDAQKLASNVTAADVVAALKPSTVQPATVTFAGGKGYSDAAEALSEVSAKPSTLAVLRGLVAHALDIRGSLEELGKETNQANTDTPAAATTADNEASAAGAAVPPVVPPPTPRRQR